MDFDKKYWSKSEFVTEDGDRFNGYVGILNGEAYVFETGEKLYGKIRILLVLTHLIIILTASFRMN